MQALVSTWPHPAARNCELWEGYRPETYSVEMAAALPREESVMWILPMGSEAMQQLDASPSISIAAVV
eukprot:1998510-Pleurochrysis_carterae.AAC.1